MSELNDKRQLFENLCQNVSVRVKRQISITRVTCPCCGYPTLKERSRHEICRLCDWEDEGEDDLHYPDDHQYIGGANGAYTLSDARENFARYGVMYPPDPIAFTGSDSEQRRALKQDLMGLYDQLLDAAPSEYPALWKRAITVERSLSKETEKSLKEAYAARLNK